MKTLLTDISAHLEDYIDLLEEKYLSPRPSYIKESCWELEKEALLKTASEVYRTIYEAKKLLTN